LPRRLPRLLPLLLPDPRLCLDQIQITPHAVALCLQSTAPAAPCPLRAQPASQVHSHYTRSAHDLPIQGRPVLPRLCARRFFCRTMDCQCRVFREQFPDLLAKHAQAITRLQVSHRDIGLALGGEPGARLAAKLGMPTSADTVLRRVKQAKPCTMPAPPPRILGVDDWAMREGQTYGTIIIDLQRGEVLELLPGRDGTELKSWLGRHPEVEVLSRDRWAAFADAATEAAPQATQVADRWHLIKNAREALERFLDRHSSRIAAAFAGTVQPQTAKAPNPIAAQGVPPSPPSDPPAGAAPEPPMESAVSPASQRSVTAKQQRRLERYHEVRRRQADGESPRSIARVMNLSWSVVRR
jgi:hypothetical protein